MATQLSPSRTTAMRKPKAPEANRARILAAAVAEFASRGFKGASMDAIAARTSTTRALINYYFGSKEKLYLAVLEHVYAEIREAEHQLELDHLPPVEAIRRIVEFTYNYYVEHEYFVRLVVAENQAKGRHMKQSPAMRTLNRPIVDLLGAVIARGQADGTFRADVDSDRRPHGDRRARDVQRHQPVHLRRHLPAGDGREGRCARAPSDGGRHGPELAQARVRLLARQLHFFNQEEVMEFKIDRRSVLKAGAALAASQALPAWAQDKPKLRFAAVFSDKDIRADMMQACSPRTSRPTSRSRRSYGGTLFKQGTELVALQRDNLEIGNIAPQDISKQMPAWSILTSAYLFRDANHLNAFFASDLGAQMKKKVEDQLKIKILGPTFFGTRQVGLKPKKKINTPADMAGIKLRMPPGDAWQLLGRSIGANPTPMAYAETYTGAADRRDRRPGQPAAQRAEHEVLRGDVADRADLAPDRLRPAVHEPEDLERHERRRSRSPSRPSVDKAIAWSTARST